MAEFRKLPTQEELQRMLFMQGIQPRSTQDIVQQNLQSQTIKPIPQNVFQKIAGGAETAGKFVNRAGTAADVARLFPGYTGQSKVNIPTGYNFGIQQDPMGGIIPQGLQTQPFNVDQILKAIKPADVLGITGAQQAYTDVGMGKAPNIMDVVDVAGLGAVGMGAGKGLLKAAEVTKGLPVGMSIKDVSGGLLKPEAQVSPIGFYSAVEQAALNTPRKSGAGQAFLNDIMKGENVKADEIKWMGLDDYLKGKQNVTRQEVQDYISNNRVNVEEVRSTIPRLPGEEMAGDKGSFLPKFASYQLPGGENYRELMLTMPNKKLPLYNFLENIAKKYGSNTPRSQWSSEDSLMYEKLLKEDVNAEKGYISSHFPQQENILAHLRVNDRVDADGKKMLLIEEVQSDWHQAGRDQGYRLSDSDYKKEVEKVKEQHEEEIKTRGIALDNERKDIARQLRETPFDAPSQVIDALRIRDREILKELQDIQDLRPNIPKQSGVPDAPFKDNWYQLALKRAIQHAAENGYDRIGLTTGSRQAERFDLSKQVDKVVWNKENGTLAAQRGGGDTGTIKYDNVTEKNLADYIGKEAAKKLIDAKEMSGWRALEGDDLRVGGEGMKKYYDEIYPKFLDKYGKKWGARVCVSRVNPNEKI